MSRPFLLVIAACVALPAAAGSLTVSVSDSAGKPLAQAVVLLDPAGGKAPVKPMADVEISQAARQFNPRVTVITVGTKVNFPNFDTVRHHVYSFSPAKTFELKLYAGVPNEPLTFDKPGVAVLGCNIHDRMAAWVVVADTPWFARTAADGTARIEGAPAGAYRLATWHPGLPANSAPVVQNLKLGGGDQRETVLLAVGAAP